MRYLVTGGLGFIGSHTVVELINNDHEVVIADNLINSKLEVLDKIYEITGVKPNFFQIDVTDEAKVKDIFLNHKLDGVIHFAGLKAVSESIQKPLDYYDNNVLGMIFLIKAMLNFGVYNIVFSSSAAVYGTPEQLPITESAVTLPTTPYGESKLAGEQLLNAMVQSDSRWKVVNLRYFNPTGAHPSGLLGENPRGTPMNLMPYLLQVATGKREFLSVYGNDYNTSDGTCIRDYLHVMDLAEGHLAALNYLQQQPDGFSLSLNLGRGAGVSVLEMHHAFETAVGRELPYRIMPRRQGDTDQLFAEPSMAQQALGWKATRSVEIMCTDLWRYAST